MRYPLTRLARAALASCALASSVLGGTEARANGRFPTAMQLATRPGHPDHIALRATFGVLFSSDGGQNWDWVCENGMGYGPRSDYLLALTEQGTAMMAALEGLTISHDGGCNWAFAEGPLQKREVIDVTTYDGDPSFVLAITANGAIAVSHDEGVTWAPYGAIDPATRPITIDVAPSDPTRVYVSALRSDGSRLTGAFFTSSDSGASFTESSVALLADERAAYIAAVDPKNANRVYLRTGDETGALPSRLLVSDNAGATFATRYTGEQMLGFALAEDGAKVYLGGVQNGLLAASTVDFSFTPRAKFPVQCLKSVGAGLWACSNEANDGFFLGLSTNDGVQFAERLKKRTVRGPLACPANSTVATRCLPEWPDTQYLLGMIEGGYVDAGAILPLDGGRPIGGGNAEGGRSGDDGCGTSPLAPSHDGEPRGVRGLVGAVAVAAAAFGWRAWRRRGR